MSSLDARLCQEARDVASSPLLRVLLFVKASMAVGCLICVARTFRKGFAWIPNPNAKMLYRAHLLIALYCGLTFGSMYIFLIIRNFNKPNETDDPCFFVFNARLACAVRSTAVAGVMAQSFNMFTFSIERGISTFFPRRYETVTKPYFGIILVIFAVVCALLLVTICYYLPLKEGYYVTTLSLKTTQNMDTYQISLYIVMGVETTTLTVFSITYYLNVKKGHRMRHFVLSSLNYSGLGIYSLLFPKFDPITSSAWVECVSHAHNYGLLMPAIVHWQTRRRKGLGVHQGHAATEEYFKQLSRAWY